MGWGSRQRTPLIQRSLEKVGASADLKASSMEEQETMDGPKPCERGRQKLCSFWKGRAMSKKTRRRNDLKYY